MKREPSKLAVHCCPAGARLPLRLSQLVPFSNWGMWCRLLLCAVLNVPCASP